MSVAKEKEKKDESYESGFLKVMKRSKYNLKINKRLKAARNRKGLSAQAVVDMLGKKKDKVVIAHSTLQGYEADENSLNHRYPSLPVLMELANFYGCSLDYLFGVSEKYKRSTLTVRETDIRDVLESKGSISYNGFKLNKKKRELILSRLDEYLAEMNQS